MLTLNLSKRLRYWTADFPQRLALLFMRRMGLNSVFSNTETFSDSDSTPYTALVEMAVDDEKIYAQFRRKYHYRAILEHVDFKLGCKYLDELNEESRKTLITSNRLRELNKPGNPRLFKFRELGLYSPTSIRYMHVAQQLEDFFGDLSGLHIAEVGIGFGGQYSILAEKFALSRYTLFDLSPVIAVSKKVLTDSGNWRDIISVGSSSNPEISQCDLAISNYAFSELPSNIQETYISGVFSKALRGYLIMNSGRTNLSGRSKGKLSLEELRVMLPPLEVFEEFPKTGPDNYLIVWGHK